VKKLACLGLVVAACHGNNPAPKNEGSLDVSIPKVDPTLCDTSGKNVVTADINHDNKPDVWRLYKTEDEGGTKVEFMTCKQVDFDHDGRKDMVEAYNRKGNLLFQKFDFDWDGKWDVSKIFDPKTGTLAEAERDTDFDGKFDVKETYDSAGALISVQRDRNGDGKADAWEQYKDGVLIAMLYDDDYDGKVDRRDEIPGAHPKVEMPTVQDPTATSNINNAGSAAGSGAGSATAPNK
jgi:hypothetical protein